MPPALLKEVDKIKLKDRKSLSFEVKHEIVKRLENGAHRSVVAKEFGLADSTIRHILKVSHKIKQHFSEQHPTTQMRYSAKMSIYDELDKRLFVFIEQTKCKKGYITDTMVCDEAKRLFDELKQTHKAPKVFYATKTWFYSFEKRANQRNLFMTGRTATNKVEQSSKTVDNTSNLDTGVMDVSEDDADNLTNLNEGNSFDDSNNFEDIPNFETTDGAQVEDALETKIIEEALNHIETAFELLERHDSNWERVSFVRRGINDSVACYKNLLITRRGKPKQNVIYDFLKNATRKPEQVELEIEDK